MASIFENKGTQTTNKPMPKEGLTDVHQKCTLVDLRAVSGWETVASFMFLQLTCSVTRNKKRKFAVGTK